MTSRNVNRTGLDHRTLKALTTAPPTTKEEYAAQMRLRVERRRAIENALEVAKLNQDFSRGE